MIAVLMSTYNGSQYVGEQLDSLIQQSFKDWMLYVRDDGSSDETVSIVRQYQERHPGKIKMIEDGLGNLGSGFSFMHLLDVVEADYYMFCDQDDVWLSTKIEKTYNRMQEVETLAGELPPPTCVFTDACVVDEHLKLLHESLWKSNYRNPEDAKDVYKAISGRQPCLGCTMLMNKAVKKVTLPVNNFVSKRGGHDEWVAFILAVKGCMEYVDEPLILYRQHGGNLSDYEHHVYTKAKVLRELLLSPLKVVKRFYKIRKRMQLLPFRIFFPKVLYLYAKRWIGYAISK